jgi:hypothetical protein
MKKIVSRLLGAALAFTAYATVASATQSVCPTLLTLPTPLAGTACPVNSFNSISIARNSAGAPNTWDYRIKLTAVKAGTTNQLAGGNLVNSAGAFVNATVGGTCCGAVDNTLNTNFGAACNCVTSGVSPNIASKFRVLYNFLP